MDYVTALVTLICIILLYVFVRTRSPNVNWGSSSQSQTFMSALKSVQALAKVEDHVKARYIYDVHKILGIFDPLLHLSTY